MILAAVSVDVYSAVLFVDVYRDEDVKISQLTSTFNVYILLSASGL